MELVRIILGVSGVLILAFAWPVWRRQRQQARHWEYRRASHQEQLWPCSGIDVSDLARRIEGVRHDYLAQVHSRQFSRNLHASLLATARQTISRLSFFIRRHTDDESKQKHP